MTEVKYQPRGMYYEEIEIGQKMMTASRTITEADVVNFAGLSGDFNAVHIDALHAAQDTFKKRVAHGLLVQSIATGLAVQTGMIEGTTLAFRELTCKFSLPIFFGDTIRVQMEIINKKLFRRLGGGNITMKYNVLNQEDKVVQRGEWVMLVKSKE
ncbi:MAG: dehydratase [Chloroflexi bacterium]|nr:MAG: dehydratase [Chloroflexota bacterium]